MILTTLLEKWKVKWKRFKVRCRQYWCDHDCIKINTGYSQYDHCKKCMWDEPIDWIAGNNTVTHLGKFRIYIRKDDK